ncbi:hypothetical protein Cgig2_005791 [Carnegiea gigantea]|uniref:Uncharacterized protein n=1 Tax=Carnegiea gigantea TaxID=171969 RepID=A0A9Q1KIC4_9CARY|nr:hypothetical protein Cgig2_005791 [Carnegiea gigantea]
MWGDAKDGNSPARARGFLTPPAIRNSSPPKRWMSEKIKKSSTHLFHVVHKVPAGDSPYVKAKRIQLIDKDPGRAVSLFWTAINSGDRVDSALKDMAVVMKQLNRSDEAIEAIKSFRHLCSQDSQESIDNILVELYKRCGRLEEQMQILQDKLKRIEEGFAFARRKVKLARSQGKKVHITVEQEYARLLGNLAWAYLQKNDYKTAEEHYLKALSIEFDRNKQCNLAVCLIHMNRISEAKFLLQSIRSSVLKGHQMDESYAKSFERASQLLAEIESQSSSERKKENCFESGNCLAFTPYKMPNDPFNINEGHDWKATPTVQEKGGHLRSPFTQPRRGAFDSDDRHWEKAGNANKGWKRLARKLQFENRKYSNGGQKGNTACTPLLSAQCGGPRSPFTQPIRGAMELDGKNWKTAANTNEAVNPLHRKLQFENCTNLSFLYSRDSEWKCSETHQNLSLTTPVESKQNQDRCDITATDVNRHGSLTSTDLSTKDLPVYKGTKKSWADIAEEDEQEENMKEILDSVFWKSIF